MAVGKHSVARSIPFLVAMAALAIGAAAVLFWLERTDESVANTESAAETGGRKGPAGEGSQPQQGLIRECPDEWYVNRMPMAVEEGQEPPEPAEYFVYDGERVETSQVDVEWVRANCEVDEPVPVY